MLSFFRRDDVPPAVAVPRDTTLQIPWDVAKTWLGSGFSMTDGQARASAFADYQNFTVAENCSTDPDVTYEHVLITDEEEYQQEINSSLKAKASIFGVGFKAAFEQLRDIKCDSKSMTSILRCSITHEPVRYRKRPKLNANALALLKSKSGILQFEEKYGEYFVAGYQKSSSLVAIITYSAANSQQKNSFKGKLSAGRGPASVDLAAGYMDNAKNEHMECSVRWQSSGIDASLLTTNPTPADVERIFKQLASCKPKKQTALLEHYSLLDLDLPRMIAPEKLPGTHELAEAMTAIPKLRDRAQQCHLVGSREVQNQASSIEQTLSSLEVQKHTSRETLANQHGKLWRLERRLDVLFEGESLIQSAQRSARDDFYRDWTLPGSTRTFHFGVIGTHGGLIEGEVQHSGIQECRVHGKGFQKQKNTVSIWPPNALIVGFRVHSYWWNDGTNGDFFIAGGGVMQDHVDVRFRTQEHKGGHWAVEAWYLDRAVYLPL